MILYIIYYYCISSLLHTEYIRYAASLHLLVCSHFSYAVPASARLSEQLPSTRTPSYKAHEDLRNRRGIMAEQRTRLHCLSANYRLHLFGVGRGHGRRHGRGEAPR